MTIPRSLALVLALIAGILGAFVARAVPRNTSNLRPIASALSAPSAYMDPAVNTCNAERTKLASIKSQLAVCLAISKPAPKTVLPESPEESMLDPSESPEIRRNRELLENDSEAVIVRLGDGTIGVYKPEEWPSDGNGVIIGKKFPDGDFGWYGRQTAHGRMMSKGMGIKLKPDGTITWLGKPAPPSVLRRLGFKVNEPDAGQGADDPPSADTPATSP